MPLVMEAPSSTEQDTREPSQPMISSNFPASASAENTSSLSSKICPQLIQGTPRAAQGSSKTSFGSGKKTPGLQNHPPRLNPQHHVQWINAEQEQHPQLRAKKKFHKWRLLSSLLTAVALALFLVIFYSKWIDFQLEEPNSEVIYFELQSEHKDLFSFTDTYRSKGLQHTQDLCVNELWWFWFWNHSKLGKECQRGGGTIFSWAKTTKGESRWCGKGQKQQAHLISASSTDGAKQKTYFCSYF